MVEDYPDYTLPVVHVGAITVEGSVSVLGTVEVKGAVTVSGTVSISGTVEVTGAVTVSGTVSVSGTVTISGDVNVTNATIDVSGSTVAISGTVTVTGSVTVSGTVSISGTVTVTGSVTVSGTVSISGSVTVTGSVTVSGPVTVSTVAADNIVIDKLTVGAYTEDRRTLSNNGVTPSWYTSTGNDRIGKFFPRGCRGFINTIDVHCKDAGAAGGTITVYISPYPGMGYIASANVTVEAEGTAAWRSATFNRMWNYDSMFIFVLCSTSNIKIALDVGAPYDCAFTTDAGATWQTTNQRYWYRAVMKAMTVGDLPVSGTINTIEVPLVTTGAYTSDWLTVASLATVTLITVNGPGKNLFLMLAGNVRSMQFRIEADGARLKFSHHDYLAPMDWADWWTQANYGIGVMPSYYDETNDKYSFLVEIPFKWKRKLVISVYNPSAAEGRAAASIDYDKAP